MPRTYPTTAAALADPSSNLSRNMAQAQAVMSGNARIIAAWMATGLTREQAYRRALGGRS